MYQLSIRGRLMYSWIRTERQKRHLSQSKLSQLTSLTQAKLSAWEHKKSAPTEIETETVLKALAQFDSLESAERKTIVNGKIKWSRDYDSKRVGSTARAQISVGRVTEFAQRASHAKSGSQRFISLQREVGAKGLALFSGCGGMALGFQESGIEVVGHIEIADAARSVFEHNFVRSRCVGHDINSVRDRDIVSFANAYGPIDVVFGGPPCQGFSLTGKRDVFDPRNQAYREFARVVSLLRPKYFVLENVRLLATMKTPDGGLLIDDLLVTLSQIGYDIEYQILNAMDFGVPQFRERIFFLGTDRTCSQDLLPNAKFPSATHGLSDLRGDLFESPRRRYATLRDCIGDLEYLESGAASDHDPLHFAVAHPSHVIEMLKDVPEGRSAHENPDPSLRPKSGYNTTYKRLMWDEPASTISTTFGMISGSRNVHPTATRSLTIREALRCQSFPDDFVVFGGVGEVRTMIGNAVPPKLASTIAATLAASFPKSTRLAADTIKVSSL